MNSNEKILIEIKYRYSLREKWNWERREHIWRETDWVPSKHHCISVKNTWMELTNSDKTRQDNG